MPDSRTRSSSEVRPLVVITDSDFGDHSIESEVLEPRFELRHAAATSTAEVIEAAADADALMVQWRRIGSEVLDRLPRLKAVIRYGTGLDNIDVAAARARGVIVRNVDDYCIEEVAEHAAAAIAAARRRLLLYSNAVKEGHCSPDVAPAPLRPANDPTGIVGYGRIGRRLGEKLASAGHPVIVHDPYSSAAIADDGHEEAANLVQLASKVNHLSLHLPLTAETAGIVDTTILNQLGPSGHLVNHARGSLVDEQALLLWLEASPSATASLDVFVNEPPTGKSLELVKHPRVLASPHIAYLSTASLPELRRKAAQHVIDALCHDETPSPDRR
jgi:D-3-phosphoglycerate dehydrogenase / 2-oxoglutarate reductase